ncbi:MAG: Uma2 family endonuclease [Gemmataceae bacterium]
MATDLLDAPVDQAPSEFDAADRYEIVDGQVVELPPMSANSSVFASRLARLVSNVSVPADLGEAHAEILFKLPLDKDRSRRPDVAFVSYSRWSRNRPIPDTNAWHVLPDLCVEVVSPTDRAEELREKVEEYFEAGVRLVWVIYPRVQVVDVYEASGPCRVLRRPDTLDGGAVIPGFQVSIADLFPPADPPAAS